MDVSVSTLSGAQKRSQVLLLPLGLHLIIIPA